MSDYQIFTDTGSDLPLSLRKELGIGYVPMQFSLGEQNYVATDDCPVTIEAFYQQMRAGVLCNTGAANLSAYEDAFRSALDAGKDVLYLGFSGALSGTARNGIVTAEALREEYPDRKIYAIDTKCASLGLGMFCYICAKKKEAGMGIDELYAWVQENMLHVCHWFTVGDLQFLKRTGRISAATALLGGMLSIKPVLHVDNEGFLVSVSKARGRGAALKALINEMKSRAIELEGQTVFISHGDCLADAETVASYAKELGAKEVIIGYVGQVIGGHSGPDTLALFFMGNER